MSFAFGGSYPTGLVFDKSYMKTALLIILCSAVLFTSGCVSSHPSSGAWEYKATTTWPEGVGGEIARFEQQGWSFVSMSSATKGPENLAVVLLFRKLK